MRVLFFGGMGGIFPLTQLLVRVMRRPGRVSPQNGLWMLSSQVAFTVPLNFLSVGAATLYRKNRFFPVAMIVAGTHYLPFITLYDMKMFGILACLLVVIGAGLALYGPGVFSLGVWVTAMLLIAFALLGRHLVLLEEK